MSDETTLVGVDGCPGGWLCVVQRGTVLSAMVVDSIADALLRFEPTLLMVDIPIGLMDSGSRECDLLARQMLKPKRHASVFNTPVRAVLVAETYAAANALHREVDNGRGMSAQSFAIMPKIQEVDSLLCDIPGLRDIIREVHPEVCFAFWNGGAPMEHPKRSEAGRAEREALIEAHWPGERARVAAHVRGTPSAPDDLNDAFAALWTAERVHAGSASRLPESPAVDRMGLRMEMWG